IKASIRRYRKCAEPMPLTMVDGIVIDSVRCAEAPSAVGAAHEHHVRSAGSASWLHTCQHVNVIVCRATGEVHRQESLSRQPFWIYQPARNYAAAEVDCSNLVKSWNEAPVLCATRANAPKLAPLVAAADKEIAVGVHIECSPDGLVRNINRIHPCNPAVGGTAKLSAAVIIAVGAPKLVLESATHAAVSPIYGEPLLIASRRRPEARP